MPELVGGHAAVSGFLVSQDRGGTWEPLSQEGEVNAHLLATSPAELEVFYLADLHIDQEKQPDLLYRSQDGGRDWQVMDTGLHDILALAVHPEDAEQSRTT